MIFPNVKVNFRTLFFCGLSGILLLVLGIYLGFSILPDIVSNKVLDSKILREGTEQWKQFMEMPFPFQFKVYLYNVENPEEVLMGAKPVVKEKGPYVYKLYRWKDEVSWNHTTDEISYYEYQKYEFDKQASGKLTEQDRVTVLNTPFLNFLYVVETKEELDGYLPSINEALKFVFGEHNGLFLINTTVKNYLFDGIRICKNGSATDGFVASMVCKMIKQNLNMTKQLRIDGNDILYATLHYKNNTHQGYFTVQSGRKHKWDTGELTRFNNETSVETWINDKYECNKIGGVTNIFPPSVDTSTRMDTFSEDICRSISLEYVRKETVEGIKGYRYVALKTTMSHSENVSENQCYCINKTRNLDGNFGCLYDGVLDLSTCQGNRS